MLRLINISGTFQLMENGTLLIMCLTKKLVNISVHRGGEKQTLKQMRTNVSAEKNTVTLSL